MQSGFGRSQGDPERSRDLREWHAEEVVHDDDRSPFRVKVAKRLLHQITVDDRRCEVTAAGDVDGRQVDLDRPMPPAAHDVDTGVHDEPAKPGIEPVRIA